MFSKFLRPMTLPLFLRSAMVLCAFLALPTISMAGGDVGKIVWDNESYLSLAKKTDLITIRTTEIGKLRNDLPNTVLPRSQWIGTNFFGGIELYNVSQTPGFPIREERAAPLFIRCLADSHEGAQNLASGQKLLSGQTLLVNESVQYTCE